MELLDRYLEAVRKHLPWQRQDDIIAELRANLEDQLEEKEATLGRPLTNAEAEAWIKSLGYPLHMAAPYQAQQYLIGPIFFPIYRNVMRIALTWTIIIFSAANAVTLLVRTPGTEGMIQALVSTLLNAPEILLQTAAWVTLIFAGIEYGVARRRWKLPEALGPFTDWSTQTLPPFGGEQAHGKKQPSYAKAVAEVIFGLIFLGWLLLLPKHPFLWLGPGLYYVNSLPYQLAPAWMQFFWICVALNIVQLGWRTQNLFSGRWQRPQTALLLVSKSTALVAMLPLLMTSNRATVLLKNPAADQVRYGAMLDNINRSIYLSLEVLFAVVAIQVIWHIVQLFIDGNRRRAAAMQ